MAYCPHCGSSNPGDAIFCGDCGKKLADGGPAEGMATVSAMETIATLPRDRGGEQIELAPGTEFANRYVIEKVLGKGGMGIVYRAQDKLVDKAIALKLIRKDRLGGEGAVKRLIAEGVTTRDIRHDHVVAVYDVGEADGQPFVSMEYIEAISLRDWHRKQVQERRDVPVAVAARIIAEILDGLTAAHDKQVIHRDLKPENILLTDDPTPEKAPLKIVDFGIARAAGGPIESGTGTGLGTPRYMAPEQITNADSAGASADLYSISVIFYELLVDVLPQGHWQPPSGGRSDIPAAIDRLIERGLANRPATRPQSAKEYRQQLVAAMGGIYPPQPGPLPVPGPGGGAKPVLKWVAIGGGALLVLGAIGASLNPDGPPKTDDERRTIIGGQDGTVTPPPRDYSYLSGTWSDGQMPAQYSIQVNPDGSFAGQGVAAGEPASIQGAFQGRQARFAVLTGGMQYQGTMEWDGQCHVGWSIDGQGNGTLHVNHPPIPNTPCP